MSVKLELRVRNVIPRVPVAIRAAAQQALVDALRVGEAVAKRDAPVRTGFLRSSIGVRAVSGTSGVLFARANYAAHVNYGTRRMAARPFMDSGVRAATDHMARALRGVEGRLPRA